MVHPPADAAGVLFIQTAKERGIQRTCTSPVKNMTLLSAGQRWPQNTTSFVLPASPVTCDRRTVCEPLVASIVVDNTVQAANSTELATFNNRTARVIKTVARATTNYFTATKFVIYHFFHYGKISYFRHAPIDINLNSTISNRLSFQRWLVCTDWSGLSTHWVLFI